MTRIYTNVPSIVAQFNVTQSMSSLQTSLERLSTGFRINSGKDDPAGLIASEVLRSEITGIKQGITNTERANMMIATADSAMNEISNLLNDIRGLVSEAANTGAMSPEMINANQLQVDASLEAIDRISASTTFMGRKLLDGSLDFTTNGVDRSTITGLAINKATFGTSKNPVTVNIQVRQPAERAELYYNHAVAMDDVTLEVSGSKGGSPFQFVKGTTVKEMVDAINLNSDSTGVIAELGQTATKGSMQISSVGDDNDIIVTAGQQGAQAGFVTIKYTKGTEQGVYVDYEESLGTGFPATINVQLQTEAWQSAQALGVDSDTLYNNNALDFTANIPGVHYNGVSINYVDGNMVDAGFQNSAQNPTGTASAPYAYYNDVATQATTLLGDINGLPAFTNGTGPGDYLQVTAVQGGSQYNDVNVQFINAPSLIPVGSKAFAQYIDDLERPGKKVLNVYVDTTNPATFNEIQAAINLNGTFTCTVNGNLGTQTIAAADCHTILAPGIQGNTNYSGGDAGTLFVVINNGVTTANDISAIFDLNSAASRGSARAASMFTVGSSIDNDGTGVVSSMQMKGAFKNGVDGGNVVTTAEEVVAALNNDKLWNQVISRQTLQDLISGKIGPFFANDTPIITAAVAPANSGKGVVSEFQEVAYYGCPYDGTGLQFLGPTGSRDIRFVAEPGNSELAIDFTSVPDRLDYSQAILHGTNPNANVVFTARTKGGENDDITFRIKHAAPYEDPPGSGTFVQHPEGWAELDNGESFAETQLFFYNGTTGAPIQNSAFYLTANERGTAFNNVNVNLSMATPGSQTASVVVAYDAARKALNIS
ncbi:MAG: hypothetical protein FWC50_15130, partial [Planctomycetaceae bacterium]|nr:hypothetical protein [Planctomycetaceae bacterium]